MKALLDYKEPIPKPDFVFPENIDSYDENQLATLTENLNYAYKNQEINDKAFLSYRELITSAKKILSENSLYDQENEFKITKKNYKNCQETLVQRKSRIYLKLDWDGIIIIINLSYQMTKKYLEFLAREYPYHYKILWKLYKKLTRKTKLPLN